MVQVRGLAERRRKTERERESEWERDSNWFQSPNKSAQFTWELLNQRLKWQAPKHPSARQRRAFLSKCRLEKAKATDSTPTRSNFSRKFNHDNNPWSWGGNETKTSHMNLTKGHVPVPVEPSHFCKSQAFLLRVKKSKATISRDLWVRTGSQSTCYYETVMSQLIQPLKLTTSPGEAIQWQWFRILPHLPISAQVINCPTADSTGDVFNRKATTFPISKLVISFPFHTLPHNGDEEFVGEEICSLWKASYWI